MRLPTNVDWNGVAEKMTRGVSKTFAPSEKGLGNIIAPVGHGPKNNGMQALRAPGAFRQAGRYLKADDLAGQGIARIGASAARIGAAGAGYVTAAGSAKSLFVGGGMFADSKGDFDIAGVPFI